jgi:hypothetical protein
VIDGGVELRFLPAAMATGVLQVKVMEGGEGVAGSLREDDVVLMVLLIGAERVCIDGSTGGRAAAVERGSPMLRSGGSGEGKWDWITRWATVDRGGADRTSDRGWGAVVGAADGEPGSRRRSGEQWRSGEEKLGGKEVCKS